LCGPLNPTGPVDPQDYVVDVDRHRRVGLVDCHLDGANSLIGQDGVSDALGQGFNQVDRITRNDFNHTAGDGGIVNRQFQTVFGGGWAGIKMKAHVNHKRLTYCTFGCQDAVIPVGGDSQDFERVERFACPAHHPVHVRNPSPTPVP
jgi:hypothetical protein